MEQRSLNAYVAELLGTFVLVFSITLVVALFVNNQGPGSDWAVVGLVHAFVLFMLIAALSSVSGGHFNPAVTVGATLLRKISPIDGGMYVIVQLIGGISGAFMTKFVLDDALANQVKDGAVALNNGLVGGTAQGLVVEALGTFFLVWAVVAMMMGPRTPKEWAPLVVGATLGFAVMVGGSLTGGCYNPARWFGPALVGSQWNDWWIYPVGDLAGGILGALTFWYLFIEDKALGGAGSSSPGP